MTKQEYLESYKEICEELANTKEILLVLTNNYLPSGSNDGMPRGSKSSDLSDVFVKREKLLMRIRKLELKREKLKSSILRKCRKLTSLESKVLIMYYLNDYSLKDISKKLNISYGYAKNLNSKAFNKFPYNEKGQA